MKTNTILDEFSSWMHNNSKLSDSSIYKYTRAVNTISNEMQEKKAINKSIFNMNLIELDIAILNILKNDFFVRKNSTGNNMYSNALKQYRFFYVDSYEDERKEDNIVEEIENETQLSDTEKQVIIKARRGQGVYRNQLLKKYDNKCIVTGIDKLNLLVASHIKPWSICNNYERIDMENGLLLCPNIDRLFDYGLVTFRDDGKMVISSYIGVENEKRLHISNDITVDLRASERLLAYLQYHRDVLFVK